MTTTKKDFIIIAGNLQRQYAYIVNLRAKQELNSKEYGAYTCELVGFRSAIQSLCFSFKGLNPLFDEVRFKNAIFGGL